MPDGLARGLSRHDFHFAAAFTVAGEAYLCEDTFAELFAVRDDAHTPVGLACYVLEFFECGHDAV